MTKKTIAILILAGGILTAFLIARLTTSQGGGGGLSLTTKGNDDPAFTFGENNNTRTSGSLQDAYTNLTEQVVRRYGEEALKLNQRDSSGSSVVLPPDGTLENLIADALERTLSLPSFSAKDLSIVPLTGKEGLATYFTSLVGTQEKHFGRTSGSLLAAIAIFVSEGSNGALETQRNTTSAYVGDLLSIAVPSPLVPFHVGLLNLWQKRVSLADQILASEEDPLKVVVAVDHLAKTVDEETQLLKTLAANLKSLKL
ncbi:MAG: hypothetical protein Q8P88_01545 [Candidatus Jorgensenbacteria bacterium]|nr:hypothetical protein [Candidatus Jorgensenbacteria bacterium]